MYVLALILAGDELVAEKCFLAAFDSCAGENRVFKESALSWSRRSVIKNDLLLELTLRVDAALGHRVVEAGEREVGQRLRER